MSEVKEEKNESVVEVENDKTTGVKASTTKNKTKNKTNTIKTNNSAKKNTKKSTTANTKSDTDKNDTERNNSDKEEDKIVESDNKIIETKKKNASKSKNKQNLKSNTESNIKSNTNTELNAESNTELNTKTNSKSRTKSNIKSNKKSTDKTIIDNMSAETEPNVENSENLENSEISKTDIEMKNKKLNKQSESKKKMESKETKKPKKQEIYEDTNNTESEDEYVEKVENDEEFLENDESKFDTISLKEVRKAIENKIDNKQKKSVIKESLINVGIAILMVAYLIILIMGSKNIDIETLEKDLKIMTLGILAMGIVILEISYKKDNSKLAINGVEVLIFGATNLCLIFISKLHMDQFVNIITYISLVIGGYYIFKSIVLAITNLNRFKKDNSDIKEIIKK